MAITAISERRTSADLVFEHLYDEILSLGLLPGAKMSEIEVAEQFGVSRQPVRDAFNRLGNLGLLLIQPQRATLVQKFSLAAIDTARFVRLAIELELLRLAAEHWTAACDAQFEKNLKEQEAACADADARRFHDLDREFHRLIADVAGKPDAHGIAMQKKAMIDRICVLSLKEAREMQELVGDHRRICDGLRRGDAADAERGMRAHLSRIEKTIAAVREAHAEYFDD